MLRMLRQYAVWLKAENARKCLGADSSSQARSNGSCERRILELLFGLFGLGGANEEFLGFLFDGGVCRRNSFAGFCPAGT